MGRYSDSDEDRKKRKKKKKRRSRSRSRSRSDSVDSRYSSKSKKSKKTRHKNRSRSRSRERSRRSRSQSYSSSRHRRSRSRSYRKSRSQSRSRDKYYKRSRSRSGSRSRSYSRYSRSRSRSRDRYRSRRERSRDRSRDRGKSKGSRTRSNSPLKKDIKKEKIDKKEDPCANIPGFAEMTPSEQASIRMKIALKAAAMADEKLKDTSESSSKQTTKSFEEQVKFSQAVQDIESSGFSASAFKTNRMDKKETKAAVKDEFLFGTAGEFKLDTLQRKPVIIDVNTVQLAHENFNIDPDVKLDRWIQKLTAMRKKKLEGNALS